MEWLTNLMSSPIAWTILSAIAIFGFIFAIISHFSNKEKKEFSYVIKSNALIRKKKSKFDKLMIKYDGQQIEDFYISKITIWNSGNKTINESDMVNSKEITISVEEGDLILDSEVIVTSEETNNFTIRKIDDRTIKVLFDYTDRKDGAVVQIIHTGTSEIVHIDCKIKGGKPIKNYNNDFATSFFYEFFKNNVFLKASAILICFLTVLWLALTIVCTVSLFDSGLRDALISPPEIKVKNECDTKSGWILMTVVMWLYCIFFVLIGLPLIKKIFKIGIPKALKAQSGFED